MFSRLSQKLYLRIWLAVVSMLILLSAVTMVAWRIHVEEIRSEALANPPALRSREIVVKNDAGDVIGQAQSRPNRKPGAGIEFDVALAGGQTITVQMLPRPRPAQGGAGSLAGEGGGLRPGTMSPPPLGVLDWRWVPAWARPPFSFLWLLVVVSVAIALGAYPIARRLTQRIEVLRDGVRRFGEGDLSARVAVKGRDEVAYLTEQFNGSAQRVQALVESQKSLLANASHELRSPLARIRMGIEMLSQGDAPTPIQDRTVQELKKSIAELDQLVEEILLASRLDAASHGKLDALGAAEPVDLLGVVAQECARVGAHLHFDARESDHMVVGDVRLITRVVRNLLENAKRYSGGEIDLTLQTAKVGSQERMQLSVADHGPGVPIDQRDRIFEPFYRLPGASEREGGVGLGLALVKSIVEQHGGGVRCTTRADGQSGACFVVDFPKA